MTADAIIHITTNEAGTPDDCLQALDSGGPHVTLREAQCCFASQGCSCGVCIALSCTYLQK